MTTRNQRYEQNMRNKGLVKRTFWIPADAQIEVEQIIKYCVENRDYVPFMVRNIKTGKFKKGVE